MSFTLSLVTPHEIVDSILPKNLEHETGVISGHR